MMVDVTLNEEVQNSLDRLKHSDQILRICETCEMFTEVAVGPVKKGAGNKRRRRLEG